MMLVSAWLAPAVTITLYCRNTDAKAKTRHFGCACLLLLSGCN